MVRKVGVESGMMMSEGIAVKTIRSEKKIFGEVQGQIGVNLYRL